MIKRTNKWQTCALQYRLRPHCSGTEPKPVLQCNLQPRARQIRISFQDTFRPAGPDRSASPFKLCSDQQGPKPRLYACIKPTSDFFHYHRSVNICRRLAFGIEPSITANISRSSSSVERHMFHYRLANYRLILGYFPRTTTKSTSLSADQLCVLAFLGPILRNPLR